MSKLSLTSMQAQLLSFIEERLNEGKVAPSFEEMKLHLGLRSKSGVHRLMNALEERGHLTRSRHRARAITLGNGLQDFSTDELIAELQRRGGDVTYERRAILSARAA